VIIEVTKQEKKSPAKCFFFKVQEDFRMLIGKLLGAGDPVCLLSGLRRYIKFPSNINRTSFSEPFHDKVKQKQQPKNHFSLQTALGPPSTTPSTTPSHPGICFTNSWDASFKIHNRSIPRVGLMARVVGLGS